MTSYVIDSSVAIKWVVPENGSEKAIRLLKHGRLSAPDLLIAECANILWKKWQRSEISRDEAIMAAQVIERAAVELVPMRGLLAAATELSMSLAHPAYDCVYLAHAFDSGRQLVTSDNRLKGRLAQAESKFQSVVLSLDDATAATL